MVTIRRGLTRIVILTRRWAVKIPRATCHGEGLYGVMWGLARGVSANLSERQESGATGVCPVVFSLFGLVNIYPRCEPVTHEPTAQEYADTGYFGPAEKKPENLGYLRGRMVFVDYDSSWNDRPPCAHVPTP